MNNAADLIRNFQPALKPELLKDNDFFTLYPPDGGGGFAMLRELGGIKDAEIEHNILKKNCLAAFGRIGEFDYHKFERWTTIERGCWVNRLYFIVPLARRAMLKKDRLLARLVLDVIFHFNRTQPAPATAAAAQALSGEVTRRRDEEYNQGLGDFSVAVPYQWYDFQPASRIIHLLHAMWFLQDLGVATAAEQEEFAAMIRTHGRVIADQEEAIPLQPGNHQALRGLGLLYAGCFLGEQRFIDHGVRIANHHITHDFLPDGLLCEVSPTYHCFETWIARDCCNLARLYNFQLDPATFTTVDKASAAAAMVCRPDGRAVVIEDGCNLELAPFLRTLPQAKNPSEFSYLPDNRLAVWRTAEWFLLFDASPFTGRFSHYHAGKNAPTLWYRSQPFLSDAGCCDYDDPDFTRWFKNAAAHSTLLLDGGGDGTLSGMYEWPHAARTELSPWGNGSITGTVVSDAPHWENARWTRRLTVRPDGITIADDIQGAAPHRAEFLFVLHPAARLEIVNDATAILYSGDAALRLEFSADSALELSRAPGKYCDGTAKLDSCKLCVATRATALLTKITPLAK